jgi:L-lactate utilization protein LutB
VYFDFAGRLFTKLLLNANRIMPMLLYNKTGNVRINLTLGHVRVTVVAVEKLSITYTERMSLALVIQHAKRMRRIMSSVASIALPYFSTLYH